MTNTPLSVISENTLLHSTITVDELIDYAKKHDIKTLALTDKNVMYGAIRFYEQCLKNDIKPIIGLAVDILAEITNQVIPMTLYAVDERGYTDLVRLSSIVSTNESKTIDLEQLASKSQHLVAIISPIDNDGQLITQSAIDFTKLSQFLNDKIYDIYLGIDVSALIDSELQMYKETSQASGIELIPFQTVNRLYEDDDLTIEVLRAIDQKKTLEDEATEHPSRFHALETVLKSHDVYQEMGLNGVIENAEKLISDLNVSVTLDRQLMPKFKLPAQENSKNYLKKIASEGLKSRINHVTEDYVNRLNNELKVINDMGFSDYFLVVWDIVAYAKGQGIQTGPGRGSAAGSLVAYALNITDVDPLKYDLLFERFLNHERSSPPDIDLDVPDNKRERIIHYIQSKYGEEHVAQIITFGTLGAKQAIRDTARIMGHSPEEINTLSKSIPSEANMTLEKAYSVDNNFKALINSSDINKQIYQSAQRIEGLKRNVSTHASGVVISSTPLTQTVPIQSNNTDLPITQYDMNGLEKVGLVKFDILGSKNLAILNDAIHFVKRDDDSFDVEKIPLDDQKALKIFEKADTNGIFQFESEGMRRFLQQLQANSFDDIVAAIALFRPGPMKEISRFINRRNGTEPVEYVDDSLEELLQPTYGIMIYQEQVMRTAQIIAGYSLGEADILRRAMGHKDRALIEKEEKHFIKGAVENGYSSDTAEKIYRYIERFADYGFNKSHAVAYSILSYQLAYLKAHYPTAFFAAIMRHATTQKLKKYGVEAKNKNITFLGPDINKSRYSFEPEESSIRIGLSQIKHLQRSAITETLKLQKGHYFSDFISYVKALDVSNVTEKNLEALIYSGAFDYSDYNRKTLINSLENILSNVANANISENLFSLFQPHYIQAEDYTVLEKVEQEFEYLNFSITSHPIQYYEVLRKSSDLNYIIDGFEKVRQNFLVTIMEINTIQTKKGDMMARLKVSDETGKLEVIVFPETYRQYIKVLEIGMNVSMTIKQSKRQGDTQYIVERISDANKMIEQLPKGILFIRLDEKMTSEQYQTLTDISQQFPGNTPIYIYINRTDKTYRLKKKLWIDYSEKSKELLVNEFGHSNVVLQKR